MNAEQLYQELKQKLSRSSGAKAIVATDLIGHDEWLDRTRLTAKPRSPALRKLDKALETYERTGGTPARIAVGQALEDWKRQQGAGPAWKHSARNLKSRAFEDLAARLAGGRLGADLDEAPAFMREGMHNSRLGVVYLFSHVRAGGVANILQAGLGVAGVGVGGAWSGTRTVQGLQAVSGPMENVSEGILTTYQNMLPSLEQVMEDAAKKVLQVIKEFFKGFLLDVANIAAEVKLLVNLLVGNLAKKVAPFVGGAFDIVSGVAKMVDAAIVRLRTWLQECGVQLMPGHAMAVVNALKRSMHTYFLEGLYSSMKGAATIAMNAASFGASSIVDAVVAAVEAIVIFAWRLAQRCFFNAFCKDAQVCWNRRDAQDAIHRQPLQFERWFAERALRCTPIAALTLNSGICGDKMRFLQMFTAGGLINQEQFDRGVTFLDSLKPYAAEVLSDSGLDIRGTDKLSQGLVEFAARHGRGRHRPWYDKARSTLLEAAKA